MSLYFSKLPVCLLGLIIVLFAVQSPASHAQDSDPSATPVTAPDDRILYMILEGSKRDIYVMNSDGSDPTRLTTTPEREGRPEWSPDHSQIVFEVDDGTSTSLRVMDADGTNVRELYNGGENGHWSPDGTEIVFVAPGALLIVRPDGSDLRTILTDEFVVYDSPSWSPDGTRILFVAQARNVSDRTLYMGNPDGRGIIRLTEEGSVYHPSWSPDGELIAFLVYRNDTMNVDVVRMDSREQTPVTETGSSDIPFWSPDGQWLTVTQDNDVYIADRDTWTLKRVTRVENATCPRWVTDEHIAFMQMATQIYRINMDGSDLMPITDEDDMAFITRCIAG